MKIEVQDANESGKLLFLGMLLFFLGLIVGLFIPMMANPRMGLSAHLEGVMNGMFLVILGLIWQKILLGEKTLKLIYFLTLFGTFANFLAVAIAGFTGAGKMMPIAGGKQGTLLEELIISSLLVTITVAMLLVGSLVLIGLYKNVKR